MTSSSASGGSEPMMIQGVKVQFPCKPYPSQLTMMNKIIKCLKNKENSLLESPTGSGKSLALLCSSLAWLVAEKDRMYQHQLEIERSIGFEDMAEQSCCSSNHSTPVKELKDANIPAEKTNCLLLENLGNPQQEEIEGVLLPNLPPENTENVALASDVYLQDIKPSNIQQSDCKERKPESKDLVKAEEIVENHESSEDADFQVPKKRFRTPAAHSAPTAKRQRQSVDSVDNSADVTMDASMSKNPSEWTMELAQPGKEKPCTSNAKEKLINNNQKGKDIEDEMKKFLCNEIEDEYPPKIFFGTRTHKQIAQIVRELNKTEYNTTKMCILASREHTCIHPDISQSKNKNEDCRKAMNGKEDKRCSYYTAQERLVRNQKDLECYGFTKAWDIEELVKLGKDIFTCPYFMARDMMKDADIVFCPYNYLIDPIIRSQMSIDLENQVIILDEAHNIEDCSRGAASWSVTTQKLEEAMMDVDYFITYNVYPEQHRALHSVCANVRRWILEKSEHLTNIDYEKSSKIWGGQDLREALEELGFNSFTIRALVRHFKEITNPKDPTNVKRYHREMKATTGSLFEGLFMVLSYLLKDNYKFLTDYRMAIIKSVEMVPADLSGDWKSKKAWDKKWVFTLNFWCLSPAVAFSDIGHCTRSVILTSGTLSPMSTFSSELGIKFPIQLEANHVIAKSQVWVSSLSVGPSGSVLNATYRFTETFSFQDEVGEAIYNVCQVVPYGVLCFLPSYSMLDKLVKRWKGTGLWGRLSRLKHTFSEPKRGDKTDFNDTMHEFYNAIKDSETAVSQSEISGALFLAVCRGKVSEGLDFADNNARAVITVGIPFPNVKDIQVELKRKYNNENCAVKGLLNGSQWYETQAFRALNQALGRCIRHRNDWGAILLIDERFGKSDRYKKGLSKWIRNKVVHHKDFKNSLSSLKAFTQARLENPSPAETPSRTICKTPGTPSTLVDLEETKSNLESPMSVSSDSQSTPSPSSKSDKLKQLAEIEPNPDLHTPIPKTPHLIHTRSSVTLSDQVTPQLSSGHVTASTPVVAHGMVPKALCFTTINNFRTPSSVGGSNGQLGIIGGVNRPVFLQRVSPNVQVVSPAGLAVGQEGVLGQPARFGVPQVSLRLPRNESHLGINWAGVMGNVAQVQNIGVAEINGTRQLRPLITVKSTDCCGSLDARGECEDAVGSDEIMGQKVQMIQKRPLFVSQGKVTKTEQHLVPDKEFENKDMVGISEKNNFRDINYEAEGKTDFDQNVDGQPRIEKNAKSYLEPSVSSPESPLLFVTPPASLGNSDDTKDDQLIGVETGNMKGDLGETVTKMEQRDHGDYPGNQRQDKNINGMAVGDTKEKITPPVEIPDEHGKKGESCLVALLSPANKVSTIEENAVRKNAKDLLDIVDAEQEKIVSNDVRWKLSCSACGSNFLTEKHVSSDVNKPAETEILSDSFLGNILGTLFSLSSNKTKKEKAMKTIALEDFDYVQGCTSAFSCFVGKQNRREAKLNSIFAEKESRCYVPLTCTRCEEARKPRNHRVNVVAVRALPCGGLAAQDKSPVWFVRDKVQLNTPSHGPDSAMGTPSVFK